MKRIMAILVLIGAAGFAGAGELERLSQSNALTRVGNSGVDNGITEQLATSVQLGKVNIKNIRKVGVAGPASAKVAADAVRYKRASREEVLAASRAYAAAAEAARGKAKMSDDPRAEKRYADMAAGNDRLSKYLSEKAQSGGTIKRDAVVEMAIQGGYTKKTLMQWMHDAVTTSPQDIAAIAEGGHDYASQFGEFGSAQYNENLRIYTEVMANYNVFPKTKSCSSCK